MGLDVAKSEIRRAEDIAPAFDLLKGRADALFVVTEPLAASHRIQICTLASRVAARGASAAVGNPSGRVFKQRVAGVRCLPADRPPTRFEPNRLR
jgi:hypothetical protein